MAAGRRDNPRNNEENTMISIVILLAISTSPVIAQAADKQPTVKERSFLFTYAGAIKDLPAGKEISVWLPVAVSGPEQEVTIRQSDDRNGKAIRQHDAPFHRESQ
jgi:hypothetical protein